MGGAHNIEFAVFIGGVQALHVLMIRIPACAGKRKARPAHIGISTRVRVGASNIQALDKGPVSAGDANAHMAIGRPIGPGNRAQSKRAYANARQRKRIGGHEEAKIAWIPAIAHVLDIQREQLARGAVAQKAITRGGLTNKACADKAANVLAGRPPGNPHSRVRERRIAVSDLGFERQGAVIGPIVVAAGRSFVEAKAHNGDKGFRIGIGKRGAVSFGPGTRSARS